jgi:hypothetical protein
MLTACAGVRNDANQQMAKSDVADRPAQRPYIIRKDRVGRRDTRPNSDNAVYGAGQGIPEAQVSSSFPQAIMLAPCAVIQAGRGHRSALPTVAPLMITFSRRENT